MAISFVNGYLCTSCCDVAKAKRGENPHPRTGGDKTGEDGDTTQAGDASRADPSRDQAVTFGGALATDANAVRPALALDPSQAAGNLVDRLA
jgi:hypothetical protein